MPLANYPKPTCGVRCPFLGADGIGVDGRCGELGVAEPFLHQVKRDAGEDGGHPEIVASDKRRTATPSTPRWPRNDTV